MAEEKGIVETQEVSPKRFPWGQVFAWAAVFLLLLVVAIQLLKTQQGRVQVGELAPDFMLTTFEGEDIALADLEGKVVVLNFWASWCLECELEAAELQAAWEMYEPRGDVIFLGVAWVDSDKKAREYVDEFGITYPNGHDLGTRMEQAFRITGVPETFIIDGEGILTHVKIGPFGSLYEIISVIDPLLGP